MISPDIPGAKSKRAEKRSAKRNWVQVGEVKIRWHRSGDGRTYLDLRRYRKQNRQPSFVDHEEALAEARRLALELSSGGRESQALTAKDRAVYALARTESEKLGVDLSKAIQDWSTAQAAAAAAGVSLIDAVNAGIEVLRRKLHPIGDVVVEMLSSKNDHDFHGRYMYGLRTSCQDFAAAHPAAIEEITAAQIEAYLPTLNVGPRRRNNVLQDIRHLFKFARSRGYLPDKITEAGKVELIKRLKTKIGIVSPAAMQVYLEFVREEYLPWVVINAFSGCRAEELVLTRDSAKKKDVLRWEDFDWDAREICIRAEVAKTGIPRRCPILDNLNCWLQPWRDRKATGPICPKRDDGRLARPDHERTRFLEAARAALANDTARSQIDLTYPHNGLRHSYGSYRMAIIKNMDQLAYEMGNSVSMIKRNYHNPRPVSEGQAWFAIFPEGAENVTQLTLSMA